MKPLPSPRVPEWQGCKEAPMLHRNPLMTLIPAASVAAFLTPAHLTPAQAQPDAGSPPLGQPGQAGSGGGGRGRGGDGGAAVPKRTAPPL